LYNYLDLINDKDLLKFCATIKRKYKVNKEVKLYNSDVITSACTFGLIKHVIILPKTHCDNDLKIVICHELSHIKSHDTIFRLIRLICLSLYWFNPLMYIMSNSFDEISELACDEKVTKHLNYRDRFRYENLIIEATSNNNINELFDYL